uniref:Uncharacterized protein n=1 Tax=Arundo donax TaxID=35708 RepID=A0A0A9F0X0_ARUDO
MKVLTHHLNF